jgi:hypothetical protein
MICGRYMAGHEAWQWMLLLNIVQMQNTRLFFSETVVSMAGGSYVECMGIS